MHQRQQRLFLLPVFVIYQEDHHYVRKPLCLISMPQQKTCKTISASIALAAAASSLAYLYVHLSSGMHPIEAEALTMSSSPSNVRCSGPSSALAELKSDESRTAFQTKSTQELLLALCVYKLCSFPWLVDNAPLLIQLAELCHLEGVAYWVIKHTFFRHFCGGETPEECVASMDRLGRARINCILDLSVEADIHQLEEDDDQEDGQGNQTNPYCHRRYGRQEQHADLVVKMTKQCLYTAARGQQDTSSSACTAIKITAFAPPELLLRINIALWQLDQAFERHQVQGQLDQGGLRQVIEEVLPPATSLEQQRQREDLIQRHTSLDQIEFLELFNFQHPSRDVWWHTTANCHNGQEVLLVPEDLNAYDRMLLRLEEICAFAHRYRIGLMVDAEQSYFQETIDHVTKNLQYKFNRREDLDHAPTVYNTYQMYTKTSLTKLERDVETARRANFTFAAKLVRGAYMISERKRADRLGYASPIHDTIEATHRSYNQGVRFLLHKLAEHQEVTGETLTARTSPIVFVVASHNRESILLTVEEMGRHNISPPSGAVRFGQLFGMQDQIAYTLSKHGYSIYKYLPYGKIDEVIPYLLRRAQENSAILGGNGGIGRERNLIWQELKGRWTGTRPSPQPSTSTPANTADTDKTATTSTTPTAAATTSTSAPPDVPITETA
ncbi:hypothetical protein EC973_001243 [Apophysomyces ossiformis]|uniref:Proline dehydrogenase n=1 Tax=Apophysomyces ossiformis TaxID=679940 RepID=A0A8H7ENA7_9FUNG|nr:hypothetical protein EC973_001243 [Apophysomyces ossiformis]